MSRKKIRSSWISKLNINVSTPPIKHGKAGNDRNPLSTEHQKEGLESLRKCIEDDLPSSKLDMQTHYLRYAIMFAYTSCWYRLKRSQPMPKIKNVFQEMDCSYWNSPTADTIISRLPELIPESLKAGRLGRYVPQTLLRLMSQLKS